MTEERDAVWFIRMPQYFKFTVANPLAVRTKVRHLADSTLLEACIENCTRNPLFLSSVNFESSPAYVVTPVDVEPTPSAAASDATSPLAPPPPDAASSKESAAATILGTALRGATIVRANSGSRYYLFRLTKAEAQGAGVGAGAVGGGTLGKLEIQWRLNMGEPGRLQTQQILGGTGFLCSPPLPALLVSLNPFFLQRDSPSVRSIFCA